VVARVRAEVRGMFCIFPMVIFSACSSHTGLVSKRSTPEHSCWAQPALIVLGYEHSLSQPAVQL
jgi:hypothetical protein